MRRLALALILLTMPGLAAEDVIGRLRQVLELKKSGEYQQAVERYRELISTPAISANIELRAYVLSQMADAETELGHYQEAETATREALRILAAAGKNQTSTFAIAEGALAQTLRIQGNYAQAATVAEHAIAVAQRTMSSRQPYFAILLSTLAQVLLETGDLRRARQLCLQAIESFKEAEDGNRVDLGSAYQNLAAVYAMQGKPKQALDAGNSALSVWSHELPPGHPFVVDALGTKMVAYRKLKAFRQAEELIPQTLERSAAAFGPGHRMRIILLNNAAAVYIAEKKYEQAEPLLHDAVERSRRAFPPGHPLLINVLLNYSELMTRLHRQSEASLARAESHALLAFPK